MAFSEMKKLCAQEYPQKNFKLLLNIFKSKQKVCINKAALEKGVSGVVSTVEIFL